MNLKNILFRTFAATALFWAVACEKPEANNGNGDGMTDSGIPESGEINGTFIEEGNNAIGLVSDSNTGKGIPGVAVSDGFSVIKTDGNGVYQFKASKFAKTIFISIPSEYEVPLDSNKKPLFYKIGVSKNKINR